MKAICTKCKKEFNLSQDMIVEKYVGAMITETYYNCPKCNYKHFVCLQNAKTRRIKRAIAKLNPEAGEKHAELVGALRMEMDILNGKIKASEN